MSWAVRAWRLWGVCHRAPSWSPTRLWGGIPGKRGRGSRSSVLPQTVTLPREHHGKGAASLRCCTVALGCVPPRQTLPPSARHTNEELRRLWAQPLQQPRALSPEGSSGSSRQATGPRGRLAEFPVQDLWPGDSECVPAREPTLVTRWEYIHPFQSGVTVMLRTHCCTVRTECPGVVCIRAAVGVRTPTMTWLRCDHTRAGCGPTSPGRHNAGPLTGPRSPIWGGWAAACVRTTPSVDSPVSCLLLVLLILL